MNTFIKKVVLLIVFCIIPNNFFAQTKIDEVRVNNQTTVTNCNTINFGTVVNNSLTFYYTLTDVSSPSGTLRIYLKSSSSSGGTVLNTQNIQTVNWSGGSYSSTIACSINETNVQVSGSSIYIEFETSGNIKTKSCDYPIIKTPTPSFTLSPTTLSLACGTTSARTFTVTPANIPSGANVAYSWSYNDWSGNSTSSSITLTPSSANFFPSNVSVTPFINNVAQATRTCVVSLSPFTSSATISGATNICTGTSTYTISNTAGLTVAWSLSNPSIATTSNPTNSQVNVAFNGNGAQTLTATITNACGQTAIKTFVINTGVTTFTSAATISNPTNVCTGANTFTISGVLSGQSVSWSLSNPSIATLSGSTNSQTIVTFSAIGQQTLTATITNSCGQTATKTQSFWFGIPGLSSLISPSGFPYSPTNLPLGSATGSPFWIFSTLSPDATVVSYNITRNGSTFNKPAINRNVSVTSQELGIVAGQSLAVVVTPVNSCGFATRGVSYTLYRPTLCQSGIGVGCALPRMSKPNTAIYTVFPNPSKSIVNIDLKDQNNTSLDRKKISGELFDMVGISKLKIEINNNKATFSVRELNKGIYVLKIYRFSQTETHQIVVK